MFGPVYIANTALVVNIFYFTHGNRDRTLSIYRMSGSQDLTSSVGADEFGAPSAAQQGKPAPPHPSYCVLMEGR